MGLVYLPTYTVSKKSTKGKGRVNIPLILWVLQQEYCNLLHDLECQVPKVDFPIFFLSGDHSVAATCAWELVFFVILAPTNRLDNHFDPLTCDSLIIPHFIK